MYIGACTQVCVCVCARVRAHLRLQAKILSHFRLEEHSVVLKLCWSFGAFLPATEVEPLPLDVFPAPSTGGGEHRTSQQRKTTVDTVKQHFIQPGRGRGDVGPKDHKSKIRVECD